MRKLLALILALVLAIPMLIWSFFAIAAESALRQGDYYVKALSDPALYDELHAAVQDMPVEGVMIGDYLFDSKALSQALFDVCPRQEFSQGMARTLSSTIAASSKKGKGDEPYDAMVEFKKILSSRFEPFMKAYISHIPQSSFSELSPKDVSLRPKGMSQEAMLAQVGGQLREGLEVALNDIKVDSGLQADLRRASSSLARVFGLPQLLASLLIGFALCLGASIIWSPDWASRLAFLGGCVFISSLLVLVVGIAGKIMAQPQFLSEIKIATRLGSPLVSSMPLQSLASRLSSIISRFLAPFFITGLVGASVGAGLFSMRWAVAAKDI